jgi:hypothetical protein
MDIWSTLRLIFPRLQARLGSSSREYAQSDRGKPADPSTLQNRAAQVNL